MSFSPFCKRLEEKGKKQTITVKTMAQWINLHWCSSLVKRQPLPLLCEKTGQIALLDLVWQAGWQEDT